MDPTLQCVRCGEPILAGDGGAGQGPTCARCAAEQERGAMSDDPERATGSAPATGQGPSPAFIPLRAPSPSDRIVTRSMLLPIPGMPAGPPDAMIARLEPRGLRWIDVSDALRHFLGRDREQLLSQS